MLASTAAAAQLSRQPRLHLQCNRLIEIGQVLVFHMCQCESVSDGCQTFSKFIKLVFRRLALDLESAGGCIVKACKRVQKGAERCRRVMDMAGGCKRVQVSVEVCRSMQKCAAGCMRVVANVRQLLVFYFYI